MLSFISIVLVLRFLPVSEGQQCKNDFGKTVDWYPKSNEFLCLTVIRVVCFHAENYIFRFYLYKLPQIENNSNSNMAKGYAYIYITSLNASGDWELSKRSIRDPSSALSQTLAPIYGTSSDDIMHIFYSSEPPSEQAHLRKGESKGVVITNQKQGLWLIHSTPKFPLPPVSKKEIDTAFGKLNSFNRPNKYTYPSSASKHGQMYFCVSLPSSQLSKIGHVFKYVKPRIYSSYVPQSLEKFLLNLATKTGKYVRKTTRYQKTALKSWGGENFISYAKSKHFRKDIYVDYMAADLRTDLGVEANNRGLSPIPPNCSKQYQVYDVKELDIKLSNQSIRFKTTEDYSKWIVTTEANSSTVCIGDVSRNVRLNI